MAIYKRKKTYYMRGKIYLPDGSIQGYNRAIKDPSIKRIEQARQYENDFRSKYNKQFDEAQTSFYTLFEFYEVYKRDKKNQKKTTTIKSDDYIFKKFEPLYNHKLNYITTNDVKHLLDQYYDRGLSVEYVNKIRNFINKLFNYAVKIKRILNFNPVSVIPEYKRVDEVVKEMDIYTPAEWSEINVKLKELNIVYFTFISILYYTGMRLGEVRALTPVDIDLNSKKIRINKTLSDVKKKESGESWIVTSPKTKNSIRTILIPDKLHAILKDYFKYYNTLYVKDKNSFLFGVDRPLQAKVIREKFHRAADAAELRRIRIHDLRHSHASVLINNGALDKAVADRLGNTVNEVRKTYSHLFIETEEKLINIINENA